MTLLMAKVNVVEYSVSYSVANRASMAQCIRSMATQHNTLALREPLRDFPVYSDGDERIKMEQRPASCGVWRDITNYSALITVLTSNTQSESIAAYVFSQLPTDTVARISRLQDGHPNKALQESLASNLNFLIFQPSSIYTSNRFSGIILPESTVQLRDTVPTGLQLDALNRRLLEAAFPNSFRPMLEDRLVLVHSIQNTAKTPRFMAIDAELHVRLREQFGISLQSNSYSYRIP